MATQYVSNCKENNIFDTLRNLRYTLDVTMIKENFIFEYYQIMCNFGNLYRRDNNNAVNMLNLYLRPGERRLNDLNLDTQKIRNIL